MTINDLAAIRTIIADVLDAGCNWPGAESRPWQFYAEDWRKDTPESNEDRMSFADAVQELLIKREKEMAND